MTSRPVASLIPPINTATYVFVVSFANVGLFFNVSKSDPTRLTVTTVKYVAAVGVGVDPLRVRLAPPPTAESCSVNDPGVNVVTSAGLSNVSVNIPLFKLNANVSNCNGIASAVYVDAPWPDPSATAAIITDPASRIIPAANVMYELLRAFTRCEFDLSANTSVADNAIDTIDGLTDVPTSAAVSVYEYTIVAVSCTVIFDESSVPSEIGSEKVKINTLAFISTVNINNVGGVTSGEYVITASAIPETIAVAGLPTAAKSVHSELSVVRNVVALLLARFAMALTLYTSDADNAIEYLK